MVCEPKHIRIHLEPDNRLEDQFSLRGMRRKQLEKREPFRFQPRNPDMEDSCVKARALRCNSQAFSDTA
jgi:hypothetical protein